MKKKNYLLIVFMAFVMLLSASCGTAPQSANPVGEAGEEEQPDLYGVTVKIGHHHDISNHFLRVTYTTDSLFGDKAKAHMADVAKQLNAVFEYPQIASGWETTAAALTAASAAGQNTCDVLFADSAAIIAAATGECFIPINTYPDIIDMNDTDKYGTAAMVETMMLNSEPSAVVPALWPDCTPGVISMFFVNNTLLEQTGLTDLREYVDRNEWNFENFEYVTANAAIIEDGLNIKAVGTTIGDFSMLALLSNGVKLIVKDGDSYSSELSSPKAIQALEWCKNYFTEYSDVIATAGIDVGAKDGNQVMTLISNWFIMNDLSYVIDDFAPLPFPTGPSADTPDAYRSVIISHYGVSIPVFADDDFTASLVINRMLEPFVDYPDLETLKSYYSQNIFHDSRDIEYVWKVQENCIYNYSRLGGSDIFGNFGAHLLNSSPAELIDTYIGGFLEVMNEYMVPNEAYMSSHK